MNKNLEIHLAVKQIINPITKKTLFEENRIKFADFKDDYFYVEYDRTDIGAEVNKKLQNDIQTILQNYVKDKSVFVMPVSKDSKEVVGNAPSEAPQDPALLKVGHSTVSPQKSLENVKNVIAVGSGKGGVGKSTVSLNLAYSLINQGFKVGLVDADIYGPSIPRALGQEDTQVFTNKDKKILPATANGLKFVSFGLFIKKDDPVIWRGPMLGGVLNQFFFDVEWGELDYLIIDLPPGTGDVQLSMIQKLKVDGSIIVSTPQDLALIDARRAVKMFNKMKLPIIGIVENMSAFVCDGCGKEHKIYGESKIESFAKECDLKFLGSISFDTDLGMSCEDGKPYMSREKEFEGSSIWKSYGELGRSVANS